MAYSSLAVAPGATRAGTARDSTLIRSLSDSSCATRPQQPDQFATSRGSALEEGGSLQKHGSSSGQLTTPLVHRDRGSVPCVSVVVARLGSGRGERSTEPG